MELKVVETFHDFQLYLEEDGEVLDARGMGDGVDVEFEDLRMGDEGFVEAWQREVDGDLAWYMEAYFPSYLDAGPYEEALDD